MKNRLQIAKELMRDDGVIFISIDDNEQAYLKVLCDEIFGIDNFISCFAVQHNPRGRSLDRIMAKTHEYILCYVKNQEYLKPFLIQKNDKALAEYSKEDKNGYYREMRLMNGNRFFTRDQRPNLFYAIYVNPHTNEVSLKQDENFCIEVLPTNSLGSEQCWTWGKEKFQAEKNLLIARQTKGGEWRIYRKDYLNEQSNMTKVKSLLIDKSFNNENGTEELRALKLPFDTPKPEALLKRIIEISTKEGDLVLDFFAGSGTTLAVAHKMRRRWIGIEQMDYVESITKERLKKVIEGEQGGVSKAVEWNGGGEFVYAEMMGLNLAFREKIEKAKESEIEGIYSEIKEWAFLDYRTDGEIEKWEELTLEERKVALMGLLDSNMDYLPYSEIRDKSFCVSEVDIELNGVVYGEKK